MTQVTQALLAFMILGGMDFYCGVQLVRQGRYWAATVGLVPGALVVLLCMAGIAAIQD